MVSTSTLNRDQLKQQLKSTAQAHLARRNQLSVHKEDPSKYLVINLEFKNGHPLIIATMRADGITPEMIEWYQRDVCTHATKIDKVVVMVPLETEANGTQIIH